MERIFGSNSGADAMIAGAGRADFNGFGGNDTLTGGNATDNLSGGAGNDILDGAGGTDILFGGLDDDLISGGAAQDTFVFAEAAFGNDTIADFEDGLDRLKVFSAAAGAASDFTIAGNGTTEVTLSLVADPIQTILLQSMAAMTITAADFVFY